MSDVPAGGRRPGEPTSFGGSRYIVRRRLGAGNFATVYLAYDERLDTDVAIKLLSDRWSWDAEVRGRFVQEARLIRSIDDPRVVQIRDIAETEDGRPYLVMDFATQGTLDERLVEAVQRGARPDVAQLRNIVAALAGAIGALHARRIAHRDIKPSNILLTVRRGTQPPSANETGLLRTGEHLILGDLGLAKDLAFDSGITVGVGTAGYMSPEQMVPGGRVDARTDIYAASALVAQIASGEPPDPIRRLSNGTVQSGRPLPVSLPGPLGAALARGLDIEPSARQQTIEQWHAEVDAALAVSSWVPVQPPQLMPIPSTFPPAAQVPSRPGSPVSAHAAQRSGMPRHRLLGLAAVAAIAVAGVVAVGLSLGGSSSGESRTARTDESDATDVADTVAATDAPITDPATTVGAESTVAATVAPTSPPLTLPPTVAPTVPPLTLPTTIAPGTGGAGSGGVDGPTASISGPTSLTVGQVGTWTVAWTEAIEGSWTVSPPPEQDIVEWAPGDDIVAVFNAPGIYFITLTAVDYAGRSVTTDFGVSVA